MQNPTRINWHYYHDCVKITLYYNIELAVVSVKD